ncbi:protochlorophyllide-dependent translocon component 52, chloroplastic-like isoform X1 [Ananas comosus]|uniref:Protochlorophyllide-dependent translocon component 52, chloroplastic-like isoform X1 n=1 Tax=Ananas comosus TaxID=4615 RepID=A0A6P5FEY7_ANACO|nr:protochlorophyllide-dependent translocon component 52, chloroplastic-like isoform X1 [Ananas comosus]
MESLFSLPSPCLFPTPSPSAPKTLNPTTLSSPLSLHHHHHHLRRHRSPTRTATAILRSHGLSSAPSTALSDASDPFDIGAGQGDDAKFDWYAQWYPVAPLCDLDKRAPHAKTVMGLDVVVWWDRAEGRWQVFDDRCPHRLAPLSEGRIDPRGRLQCVYHGWCFDGSGNCKYIPQAPSSGPQVHLNTKACAAVYPSVEQNKVLWFWPSTDPQYKDILEKKRPPYIEELDDPSYTCSMGIRELQYGYEVLVENLMDPAHVPYAHHGLMRVRRRVEPGRYVTLMNFYFLVLTKFCEVIAHVVVVNQVHAEADREGGGPVEITIEESNKSGFHAKQDAGYFRFIAPCLFYGAATVNQSATSRNVQENISAQPQQRFKRFLLIFMCIPVSPGRSRVIFTFPRNFAVWIDRFFPRWIFHMGQNLILDSDLYLLHVEERKIAKAGFSNWFKACYVPTKSDAMVIAFRNWLRKYSNNQVNWGSMSSEQLPPTPPREQLMDRYWSHVVQCSSCRGGLKFLKALEFSLQVLSLALIGTVAAARHSLTSATARNSIVFAAVLCFAASRWLSHFIYKTFYFHDYNHAFK